MLTLLCGLVVGGQTTSKFPKWIETSLAGYALQNDEKHSNAAIRDPKTGWFLIRDVECDGADISLLLTRDRHLVASKGDSSEAPNAVRI